MQRDAECLEDRLEHVLRVLPVDQADVHHELGAVGELAQEESDEVAGETADVRLREVDVEKTSGRPEASSATWARASAAGTIADASPRAPGMRNGRRQTVAERTAGGRDLAERPAGATSSARSETAGVARRVEQVVEHGQAGDDVRLAGAKKRERRPSSVPRDPRAGGLAVDALDCAPRPRSRSSIRS